MTILHPAFTAVFILIVLSSFWEVYDERFEKKKVALWIIAILLIAFGGLRGNVGADYPIYRSMYSLFFPKVDFSEIWAKMLFGEAKLDIEWGYVLLNKAVFFAGAPFYVLTLIISIITISIRLSLSYKDSAYPIFSTMLFFIPVYFVTDNGQMRQALGMVMCLVAYQFIKSRKLWYYLLCLYIAFAFHKSTILFLPAFWFVKIPLNSTKIFYLIIFSVLLSPLHIYNYFGGFLDSISPQDVSSGFNGYINVEDKASSFMDGLMVVYSILLVMFDKQACQKIYYYEYMRNILVVGVCCYFVFRDNPVFATRLVGVFTTFAYIVIPNIAASLSITNKRLVHLFFVCFMIFYYFVFASYQGVPGRFTPDRYTNFLWSY